MITLATLTAAILLLGLASSELWISRMSRDELSQMGLET
jgi:hypothetical protein